MSEPVSAIRNLGPASEEGFARAGMTTAEEVRALGADAAYARLIEAGTRPHFIGYYALVMGLQGRPWNDCKGDEKKALRARFDAICATTTQGTLKNAEGLPASLAKTLDEIGLLAR